MQKGYSVKFFEKSFEDEVSKKAYLKACKWLATNIWCSESYSDYIFVKLKKQDHKESDKTFKFKVELFFTVDFESEKQIFCNNCKLSVNTFYGAANPPCQTCRLTPFIKKLVHDTEVTTEKLTRNFKEGDKPKDED